MLNSYARPFLTAVFGASALFTAGCGEATSDDTAQTSQAEAAGDIAKNDVEGALGEMSIGAVDAPVTVIEYASVTCPHCATFHERVYPDIKRDYVDTGKVRFVFREFPTAPAELSVVGSMLARCAADKGGEEAYFLVLGSLFKTQQKWIYGGDTRNELMKIAAQAGIDQEGFDACVRRQELIDLINENVNEGRDKYEINSTPSFVVNGVKRNFSSVEAMSEALDEAIEKANAEG
ncbi:MAG: DsbA family protein [Pseudomonadota bacterium]